MPVTEHIVDCGGTTAVDVEVPEEDVAWRDKSPSQIAAEQARAAALARLQAAALTDEVLADLLIVLGVENE